jgi:pimeloyl-ACP methyl ester carboxylesterase
VNRRAARANVAGALIAFLGLAVVPAVTVQAAPRTDSCATNQLRQVTVAGHAQPLTGSVPVVFIHGILSTAAIWDGSSAGSIAGQAARMRGATAWTFDYGPENLDWVTNPAIGPAFATAISCLAQSSGHQVVIVAHSMGGLATQFAVSQPDPYGGMVADHVAEVITIGTPYQGSLLLSAFQALRTGARWTYPEQYRVAAEAIVSACAGVKTGPCGLLNILPSQVGTALELHSTAIGNLPPWPAGLKVYDIAGDIGLQFVVGQVVGSVDVGDWPVLPDSATAHDTAGNGKPFVENCGFETMSYWIHLHGGPCWHVNLPNNPDVIKTVVTSIRARITDALLPQWTAVEVAPGPITSVSCSGLFCAAVGAAGNFGQSHGYALTYSGGAWSKPVPLGTANNYTVSCPNATYCVAVTDTGYAYTLRNNMWSQGSNIYPTANAQPSSTDAVEDISCASPSFCVAVTAEGKALTWNGTDWSAPQTIGLLGIQPPLFPGDLSYVGISCPTTTFCIAGTDIDAFNSPSATWNGAQWSAMPPGPMKSAFWQASCASTTFCMIAGGSHAGGDISSIWNGVGWSGLSHPADEGPALGFNQISCPKTGFCVAVDGGASINGSTADRRGSGIFNWSSGTWNGPELLDSRGYLETISCSTSGLCVAADSSGNFFVDPAGGMPTKSPTQVDSCTVAELSQAVSTANPTVPSGWTVTKYACEGGYAIVEVYLPSAGNGYAVLKQEPSGWHSVYGLDDGTCLFGGCGGNFQLPLPAALLKTLLTKAGISQ